jgi:hypothetical protein
VTRTLAHIPAQDPSTSYRAPTYEARATPAASTGRNSATTTTSQQAKQETAAARARDLTKTYGWGMD